MHDVMIFRILPFPREVVILQPFDPKEKISQQVISVLDRKLAGLEPNLELRNQFGWWSEIQLEELYERIDKHVDSAQSYQESLDASRACTAMELRVYEGVRLGRLSRCRWMCDLLAEKEDRLGDGRTVFFENRWQSTQRSGTYISVAHLTVRQLY